MLKDNSPQWSCLPSYINLYHYCKHLLVNHIFKKHNYRQLVIDQLTHLFKSSSISVRTTYDLLGLAYQ